MKWAKRLLWILAIVALGRLVVGPVVGSAVVEVLVEEARLDCEALPANNTPAEVESCIRWFLGD